MQPECQVIESFKGDFADFSNFAPVQIYYKGINFPTVEHAFVASKSNDQLFRFNISQIPAHRAGEAKRRGKRMVLRRDWELVKLKNMKRFLMQKYSYERYRRLLISTVDAIIIEGNYWHDNYWGDCKCRKCKDIPGKNHLGNLIMSVRSNICAS